MTVDLHTSQTLDELRLAFAVRADLADQGEAGYELPDDTTLVGKIDHWINDGYDLFLRAHRWTFLRPTVRLTLSNAEVAQQVGGAVYRYRLPGYVSGPPLSDLRFVESDVAVGTIVRRPIETVERLRLAQDTVTGTPEYFACRPFATGDGAGEPHAWEIVVYPDPDRAYVIEADFRVGRHRLREPFEHHVGGGEHDQTIVDAALYRFAQHDADSPGEEEAARLRYAESLTRSIALDNEHVDPSVGVMEEQRAGVRERGHRNVPTLTVEGIQVN